MVRPTGDVKYTSTSCSARLRRQKASRSSSRPDSPPGAATKSCLKSGMHGAGARPGQGAVDRHVAPAEDGQALFGGDLLDHADTRSRAPRRRSAGRRCRRRSAPASGSAKSTTARKKRVGDLRQDPGSVAGVRLATLGPPVIEIAQRGQRLRHDVVAPASGDVGDHARHRRRHARWRGGRGPGARGTRGGQQALNPSRRLRLSELLNRRGRRWPCCLSWVEVTAPCRNGAHPRPHREHSPDSRTSCSASGRGAAR